MQLITRDWANFIEKYKLERIKFLRRKAFEGMMNQFRMRKLFKYW